MDEMIEVYAGSVQSWECDPMGHMNVQFYVARATDGLASLALALGLGPSYSRREGAGLVAVDHHIRFLKEFRPGAPFRVRAGVLAVGDDRLQVFEQFENSATGVPAATFIADVRLVDFATRDARPLPDTVRVRARDLTVALPDHGAPRGLALDPPGPAPTQDDAESSGMLAVYQGVVAPADCDAHGYLATPNYIARISAAVPNVIAMTRGIDRSADDSSGGAALEYRLIYRAVPQVGDILVLYSAIKSIGGKTFIWGHRLFDKETGKAVATSEIVAVNLDLVNRRAKEIPDDMRTGLARHLVPELAV